ncbi:restriction endonuclease subunit S [Roseivirga sp. BDSF3-8]|uniref:restriction endonuclease subunit S n=1 Tax=Roseivirga sp. BDSF3-8 TaxID=3241598 RepID=UPI003531E5BB
MDIGTTTPKQPPRYPAYQDSGVEWLGDIPEHWGVKRMKFIVDNISEKVLSKDCDLHYIGMENVESWTGKLVETESEVEGLANLFQEGDVLFGKLRPYLAKVLLTENNGICSTEFLVYRALSDVDNSFLNYLMRNHSFISIVNSSTYGSKMPRANSEFIGNLRVQLPPLEEQKRIADFLDRKVAQLDQAIAQKEQLIALLKERRQVLIHRAVTRGLNPDAPLQHSGIDWIGEIPAHWEVKKLKYLANMKGGFAFNSASFKESGVQIIKIANTYMNELALDRQPTFVDDSFLKTHSDWIVRKGDILMSLTGTLGKKDYGFAILIENEEVFLLNQRVGKLNPKNDLSPEYLLSVLHSEMYLNQLYQLPSGTKQANLSNEDVLNIYVAISPDKSERLKIVKFLDDSKAKTDKAISQHETQIQKLKEYKATLINAAVTGKIRV